MFGVWNLRLQLVFGTKGVKFHSMLAQLKLILAEAIMNTPPFWNMDKNA